MAADIKKVTEQTQALWQGLPTKKRMLALAIVLSILAGVIYLVASGGRPGMATLFAGLSAEDAGAVVAELDRLKIPYELEAGGTTVRVPEKDVHKLRLSLAAAGIPRGGGVGFEVFDQQTFGTTTFVEKMNYRRALQGELQRTIAAISAVKSARVHLAIQEKVLFKEDQEPPTASVVLALQPGRALSPGQVKGIVHLVSSSVEALAPGRVTVVDETGDVLASGEEEEHSATDDQKELEQRLSGRVKSILERVVGPGHVEVTVTAELDTDQTERTEELYDPEKLTLRSEQRTLEGPGAAAAAGGVVGARANLPTAAPGGAPAAGAAGAAQDLSRVAETRNYEVNRIFNRIVGARIKVKRLHVAVLVDGKTVEVDPSEAAAAAAPAAESAQAEGAEDAVEEGTEAAKGEGAEGDEAEGASEAEAPAVQTKVVPRTAEELAQLERLAREAAGLDEARGDRIEVQSVPFVRLPTPEELAAAEAAANATLVTPRNMAIAAGSAVVLISALMFFLMRGRKRTVGAELVARLPAPVGTVEATLDGQVLPAGAAGLPGAPVVRGPDGKAIPGATAEDAESASSPRETALQAIREDTKKAAHVLAAWAGDAPSAEQGA